MALPSALPMHTLILATHNSGKLAELHPHLAPFFSTLKTAGALGLTPPAETGRDFTANARIKAEAVAAAAPQHYVLADDSGLCIEALGGKPGVDTADWARHDGHDDYAQAFARINADLGHNQNRAAEFICVLLLRTPQGQEHIFTGHSAGTLLTAPRGQGGFGYDPIFVPQGYSKTMAELSPAEKHALSHRGRALAKLIDWLQQQ